MSLCVAVCGAEVVTAPEKFKLTDFFLACMQKTSGYTCSNRSECGL